jgi:DNA-binding response OmpR family regulator
VIIIEDDEGIGFSLQLALQDRGCDVTVYNDPTVIDYNSLSGDVVLVDYYMPKMDGEQVIRLLQQVPALKSSKIMLMSASPQLVAQARELGVSYIAKPFDLEALYDYIEAQ